MLVVHLQLSSMINKYIKISIASNRKHIIFECTKSCLILVRKTIMSQVLNLKKKINEMSKYRHITLREIRKITVAVYKSVDVMNRYPLKELYLYQISES